MVHKKNTHEIRDPLYMFIKLNSDERKVLDSVPLQRLRNIHQLSMSYLVYPGATHKRLEHSLGVMELATKIFDIVTDPENRYYNGPISSVSNDKIKHLHPSVPVRGKIHQGIHFSLSDLISIRYGEDLLYAGLQNQNRSLLRSREDVLTGIWYSRSSHN